MLKKIGTVFLYTLGTLLASVSIFIICINLPVPENKGDIPLGVTFSARYATDIGLNWKDAYSAMLNDLNMKRIRLPVYWDLVEKTPGQYDFVDLDWQLQQAQAHGAKVILVMGKKVPRWPECYVPKWVSDNPETADPTLLKEKLLAFETVVISRYKTNHPELEDWQVENEPFLDFGICGTVDPNLLDAEIANAKRIDPTHPIVVTDSGELSLWMQAAKRADIFGTTMYREVYSAKVGHWRYPIGPNFFKFKKILMASAKRQAVDLVGVPVQRDLLPGWVDSLAQMDPLAGDNNAIQFQGPQVSEGRGQVGVHLRDIRLIQGQSMSRF